MNFLTVARDLWKKIAGRHDEIYQDMARNSLYAILAQGSAIALTLLETFLLARYFSQSAFGLYILAVSTASLVFEVADFKTQEAAIRFIPRYLHQGEHGRLAAFIKSLYLITTTTAILSTLIIIVGSQFLASTVFAEPRLEALYAYTVVFLFPSAVGRPSGSILRAFNRMKDSTKYGILINVFRIAILIFLLLVGINLHGLLLWRGVGEVLGTSFLFLVVHRELKRRNIALGHSSLSLLDGEWKSFFLFITNTSLSSTLKAIGTRIDVAMVGMYCGLEQVALYKVASRIGHLVLMITDPLYVAIFPEYSHLVAQKKYSDIRAISKRITIISVALGTSVLVILALFGRWIVRIIAGHEYLSAYVPLLILSTGIVIQSCFFWVRPLLLSLGKADVLTFAYAAGVALQVVLLLLFLRTYQVVAASVALAVMYMVFVALELVGLNRQFSVIRRFS